MTFDNAVLNGIAAEREYTAFPQSEGEFTLLVGDCVKLIRSFRPRLFDLVLTSPPYNLGKEYERRKTLFDYLAWHDRVIDECSRVTKTNGSICWQVGNYVDRGQTFPLDMLLYPLFRRRGLILRNRIVWHFPHGAHMKRRFSGRHEVVLWFTKSDSYYFDLDPVRVPQLYPRKRFYRGPRKGQFSCNPLGKNPGDVWEISNIKHNHPEKTAHPCQFPEELVRRLILSLTHPGDYVLDPFLGSGTTAVVALSLGRRVVGIELVDRYAQIAMERIRERALGLTSGTAGHKGSVA